MSDEPRRPGQRVTAFGEPLWVDVLKTAGVAGATLLVMLGIGALLGMMILAPWGRASFDCSMYCVIKRDLATYFEADD